MAHLHHMLIHPRPALWLYLHLTCWDNGKPCLRLCHVFNISVTVILSACPIYRMSQTLLQHISLKQLLEGTFRRCVPLKMFLFHFLSGSMKHLTGIYSLILVNTFSFMQGVSVYFFTFDSDWLIEGSHSHNQCFWLRPEGNNTVKCFKSILLVFFLTLKVINYLYPNCIMFLSFYNTFLARDY